MPKIPFRPGLRSRTPLGGAYSAPQDPLAGFRGPTFKGGQGIGEGREGEGAGG